jgi:hypothetical protein
MIFLTGIMCAASFAAGAALAGGLVLSSMKHAPTNKVQGT